MTDFMPIIQESLDDAVGQPVEFSPDAHLLKDEVLDSLDSAVFLLNLEKATGVLLPENTVEEKDLFKIANLIQHLEAAQS